MSKDIYDKEAKEWLGILLIIFLGFIVYGNSLNCEFVFDDVGMVKDNAYIKDFSFTKKFFIENITSEENSYFYRPLVMISYAIDYSIWKLNVRGYHLTNIMLHGLVALAVYWLINILFGNRFVALLTSMVFVIHPIHTETVTYISGRSDCLAGLFMILSFIFYIKRLHTEKVKFFILMIVAYIGAFLSRETTLIFPLLLLAYHYAFRKKIKAKEFFSFFITAFIYILLRLIIFNRSASDVAFFQRLPGFFVAITDYIRLLIFPFNLHMVEGIKLFSPNNPKTIAGILIFIFLLIYAFKNRKNNVLVCFSISWFLVALLPVSNVIYPLNAYMREHWLYVPSIGFFLILAAGLEYLYNRKRFHVVSMALILGLLVFYSYLTIRQNEYWREPVGFYKNMLKYDPYNYGLYINLGNAYTEIGNKKEAIISYKKALSINPDNEKAYGNLGMLYNSIDRKEEAIAALKKALEINPNYAKAYFCLSMVYFDKNEYNLAVKYCDRATELGFIVPSEFLETLKGYRKK